LQNSVKALVATRDETVTAAVCAALDQLQIEAVTRSDADVPELIRREQPQLLILHAELPGAVTLCRTLRGDPAAAELAIIAITPEGSVPDKVAALEAGADDCVTEPLHVDELVARIKALRRRASPAATNSSLKAGSIEMDLERWTVTLGGRPMELTKMEFRLLQALLEAKGRALSRDFLLEKAWSHGAIHGLDTRTVDVHIGRLRRKLGDAAHYIITVRNVGFRFEILPEWISGRTGH